MDSGPCIRYIRINPQLWIIRWSCVTYIYENLHVHIQFVLGLKLLNIIMIIMIVKHNIVESLRMRYVLRSKATTVNYFAIISLWVWVVEHTVYVHGVWICLGRKEHTCTMCTTCTFQYWHVIKVMSPSTWMFCMYMYVHRCALSCDLWIVRSWMSLLTLTQHIRYMC